MDKIGFVTDSTAYLSAERKARIGAEVVSLTINFGNDSFPEEGLYDSFDEFYDKLRQVSYLPTTSQPSVGDFINVYEVLAKQKESIISLHISSGISGTVNNARIAAQMLPDLDITVVDSQAAAIGEYLVLDAAAQAVAAGYEKDAVLRVMDHVIDTLMLRFMPDSLEYLHRGGRIGGASALFGSLLQIKPILFFNHKKDNIIDLHEKVRTKEKGLHRMLEEMDAVYRQSPAMKTAIVYVGCLPEARQLAERIRQTFPGIEPDLCPVGPVVGAHIGPGTLGVGCYPLTPELQEIIRYQEPEA